MTTYRLWPSASGGALVSYSGAFIAAVQFAVKGGGNWLDGYWWWVPAGGDTGAVKCALWSVSIPSGGGGVVVPGSVVTSGTLTAGSWNFVPLSSPVQLAPGWDTHNTASGSIYQAQVGWTASAGFPDTNGYWGSGGPGQAGISNGPLLAYSGSSGTGNLLPYAAPSQGLFSTASADPSATFAGSTSGVDNFWVDVQVDDTAPAGYTGSYRLWPNKYDANAGTTGDAAVNYTVATEVSLSQACTLNSAWYFSPAAATTLATRADVWRVSDGANVASVTSPAWKTPSGSSAAAGVSGGAMGQWVSAAFPGGTVLAAGDYRVSVYNSAGTSDAAWSAKDAGTDYWGQTLTGAGSGGISNGPVTAPKYSAAAAGYVFGGAGTDTPPWSSGGTAAPHAQPPFCEPSAAGGAVGFPQLYAVVSTDQTQNYWVDLEVTPVPAGAPPSPPALVPPGFMSPMSMRALLPAVPVPPAAPVPGAVSLSGSGSLAAAGTVTAGASLSGSGSVAEAAQVTALAALSGTGTLAAAAGIAAPAVLSGSGSLAAVAVLTAPGGMSGTGSLAAAGTVTAPASPSGSGTLTTAPSVTAPAALSGTGTLSAAAVLPAGAVLSGSGSAAAAGTVSVPGAAALAGSGALGAAAQVSAPAVMPGSGLLSAAGAVGALAGLSGTGTLGAAPAVTAPAGLSGSGALAASAGGNVTGAAALGGSGALTAAAPVTAPGGLSGSGALGTLAALAVPAALAGSGALTTGAAVSGGALLSGSGTASLPPAAVTAPASLSGSGTLSASQAGSASGAAVLDGSGSLLAAAFAGVPGAASLSGSGSAAAPAATVTAGASLSGSGTAAAGAVLLLHAAASLSGLGVITASAQVVLPVTGPAAAWSVIPAGPRWKCGPFQARWRIAMTLFSPIAALSLECVNVLWLSDLDGTVIDPTGQATGQPELPVQMAFPQTSGNYAGPAEPSVWYTASWLLNGTGRGFVAQALVGPGGGVVTLTAGLTYDVWGKVTASPEVPARFVGTLPVY